MSGDRTTTRTPTHNERVILQALLLVFEQHAGLDHKCMQAGQIAAAILVEYGLAASDGRDPQLTAAGLELLNGPVLELDGRPVK